MSVENTVPHPANPSVTAVSAVTPPPCTGEAWARRVTVTASSIPQQSPDLPLHLPHLRAEGVGGDTQGAVT